MRKGEALEIDLYPYKSKYENMTDVDISLKKVH